MLPTESMTDIAGPSANHSVELKALQQLATRAHPILRYVACTFDRGVLTLSGQLPTFYLKQLAQEFAAGVDGVHEVVNLIEVPARAR